MLINENNRQSHAVYINFTNKIRLSYLNFNLISDWI